MTKPYILFRVDHDNEEEFEAAEEIFGSHITRFRSDIPSGAQVIPRYSCLPFYRDLEDELKHKGATMLNSLREHNYIAEMQWYDDLADLTPKTWFNVGHQNAPATTHGWVVKGATNSRKFHWKTHMFAPTRADLQEVMTRLYDDPLISSQGLVVREYVPLKQMEEAINGLPVTNEWRCFYLGGTLISAGYYWSMADCADDMTDFPAEGLKLANEAASRLQEHAQGFVVDVAETEEENWIVVEINDFQMSGLSCIDPVQFYQTLKSHYENP